jgi:SAM-dependent methyltransferase
MLLLNLGCGSRFHKDWINIDFASQSNDVLEHNLLSGIPFESNHFDVLYHSHLLEHFSKADASHFISECYRVLKPNGIIRIAVPDLEKIVRTYLDCLEKALNSEVNSEENYNWILLELYDQVVRNTSGGEMQKFLFHPDLKNEDFIYSRLGDEAKGLRKKFSDLNKKQPTKHQGLEKLLSRQNIISLLERTKINLYGFC